jgi:hypothetical protein
VRLYNPEWTNLTTQVDTLYRKDEYGKAPTMFEIFYKGTSSADATELGGAADSAKDGTATPFAITVVSASANDTDAANKDVRAIAVIGVSIPYADIGKYVNDPTSCTPQYSVEEVRMNGTTDVTPTERAYLHVIHAYAIEWGSNGADAAGAITVESPANTALLTIAAAANESNGSIIYGAADHWGRWRYVRTGPQDVAFNNT